MGILLQPLLRLVDAYQGQKLFCPLPRLLLRFICVKKNHFTNLVPDCIYGIQACHRILENNGNLLTADLSHLVFSHLINPVSVEFQGSPYQFTGISGQSHQAVSGNRFTGARFSYDTQDLPFLQMDGNII